MNGISKVNFDKINDVFTVKYDKSKVTQEKMFEKIKKLKYTPSITDKEAKVKATIKTIDISKLNKRLAHEFAKAKKNNKRVLIDFTGPA